MYYVMSYYVPEDDDGGYYDINDGLQFDGVLSWSLGRRWNVDLPDPIEIEILPVEGYVGPLSDLYDGNMCLMSPRLVEVLRSVGVDNLDVYRAVLRNTQTGEGHEFHVVNIIGLVAAADLGRSKWSSYDDEPVIDVTFDRIEIDERAAREQKVFRLAENTGVIMVDEEVRDHLLRGDFPSLIFSEPKHWVT